MRCIFPVFARMQFTKKRKKNIAIEGVLLTKKRTKKRKNDYAQMKKGKKNTDKLKKGQKKKTFEGIAKALL